MKIFILVILMEMNNLKAESIKIFLAGDVMTGRGIDQILLFPSDPILYEGYVKDAREYLSLAEGKNGKIPRKASDYIWGDALKEWKIRSPDFKAANLETSITSNPSPWPSKGINYRMNPKNTKVLKIFDALSLSNNHVLDWKEDGLLETMASLKKSSIKFSGAGKNLKEAIRPAIKTLPKGKRILFFSWSHTSSGVPLSWKARTKSAGVNLIEGLEKSEVEKIIKIINSFKKKDDFVIFSIHWGSNWGYDVSVSERSFAQGLIDKGVDVFAGHSSHHPKPIEVYKGKPIFYGLGDFLNDYEGISGYEEFRGDLSLMYFLKFDKGGNFKTLELVPMQTKKFRLNRAITKDAKWIFEKLSVISKPFGTKFSINQQGIITLK